MDAAGIATLITQGMAPPVGSEDMGFHTGVIQSWDEASGTNVVVVQGVSMPNLKTVQGGIGVLYQPGDVVAVMRFQITYFVFGKIAAPGAGAANQIRSASVNAEINCNLQGYAPLPGSSGPTLNSVYIGSSRRALVILSALTQVNNSTGSMGFSVTGASGISANLDRATYLETRPNQTSAAGTSVGSSCTKAVLITSAEGLNSGFNNFDALYQVTDRGGPGGAGSGAVFRSRSITVIPF